MFENIILGIKFNNEQYHRKLKHSCNFDKKQRLKQMFLSIKLYIQLTHARRKKSVKQKLHYIDDIATIIQH